MTKLTVKPRGGQKCQQWGIAMDVWETTFKLMYKGGSLLIGVAANRLADAPGTIAIVTGKAAETVVSGATMVALRAPSLMLSFHAPHALALFRALRAESKYGDKRDNLRNIQESMDQLIKTIGSCISTTGSPPSSLPDSDASVLVNRERYVAYMNKVQLAISNTRAYIETVDLVLDDIARCLQEWNKFLRELKEFMKTDKPRNVFEQLNMYSINNELNWAWYKDETEFSAASNRLLSHRNEWAALLDLPKRGALPRLEFDH